MMNKQTRKLAKLPDEVRAEIANYFVDTPPVVDEDSKRLPKLTDSNADYIRTGLTVSHCCSFMKVIYLFMYYNCLAAHTLLPL